MAPSTLSLAMRALQLVLALINLGLTAYVVSFFVSGNRQWSPSSINWLLAAQVLSILSIVYLELVPRKFPRFANPFASLAVESANTLFYFAGFIAWAVFLGGLAFCNGTVCSCGRAVAVIAALEFVAWIVTTALLAKEIFKGGFRKPSGVTTTPMEQTAA
jgi:hypothetical protein